MADERWRALERRWQQTGAVEDEAALLVERVRAGAVLEERLRLAAWLGHEAAAIAAGPAFDTRAITEASTARGAQHAFWRGVVGFGTQVAARAVLAHARYGRRYVNDAVKALAEEPEWAGPDEELLAWGRAASQCVDSGVSWVLAPTTDAHAVLVSDIRRVEGTLLPSWPGSVRPEEAQAALGELSGSLVVLEDVALERPSSVWFGRGRFDAVRAAIRAEVVPWALGRGDPLRDEVDRRLAQVSNIKFASPCDVTWDSMRPTAGDARVRHCDTCDQPVFDLNKLPLDEAEAIVRAREQGQRVCVRLYRRADGSVLLRDCPVGLDRRVGPADRGFIG